MSADTGLKLRVLAAGSVVFNAGVPTFVWQSGDFAAAITDTGVGDITVNFLAGNGVDAAECVCICTPRAAQAASGLTTIGVVHTSDVAKQFTIVQEGAAGAASARADVNFDFAFLAIGNP